MKVAIIGSGPGGAIATRVLTDNKVHVTLFEKGGYYSQCGQILPFSLDEMDFKYKDKGLTVALGHPNINYIEGSCLGGGSEVNAGLYHRAPDLVLRQWQTELGLTSTTSESLLQYYEVNESEFNVTRMPFKPPPASLKLLEGANKMGWEAIEVPRWYKYTSSDDQGIYSGIRQSATEAVYPRVDRNYLDLRTNCNVLKINPYKARGVDVIFENLKSSESITESFDAAFICCGAIETPYLLVKSGIRSPYLGKNLRMHSTIKITAKFKNVINYKKSGVPVHQIKEFMPNYSFGCSISSAPYLAAGLIDNGINPFQALAESEYLATYYAMINDGVGSVYNFPMLRRPLVRFSLSNSSIDMLRAAGINLAKLLFTAGAVEIYPSVRGFLPAKTMEEFMLQWSRRFKRENLCLMTIHLMGTCAIGGPNINSPCDEYGRLRGYKNIIVGDSSIIPTALGVNPQGTLMALARRNVQKFVEERL